MSFITADVAPLGVYSVRTVYEPTKFAWPRGVFGRTNIIAAPLSCRSKEALWESN
jgi:hypothetical protein